MLGGLVQDQNILRLDNQQVKKMRFECKFEFSLYTLNRDQCD